MSNQSVVGLELKLSLAAVQVADQLPAHVRNACFQLGDKGQIGAVVPPWGGAQGWEVIRAHLGDGVIRMTRYDKWWTTRRLQRLSETEHQRLRRTMCMAWQAGCVGIRNE